MLNKFYIWKNADCNGVNPEWSELSGKEFYKFINNPENVQRKFIQEYFDEENKVLGYYRVEVNEEQYRKWRALQKRKERSEDVLIANKKKHNLLEKDETVKKAKIIPCAVSFDEPLSEDENTSYHEIVPDDNENGYERVERKMLINKLHKILETLSGEEQEILNFLYFDNSNNLSDNKVARRLGISTTTFNRKKLNILKKISEKMG